MQDTFNLKLISPKTFQIVDERNAQIVTLRFQDVRQLVRTWCKDGKVSETDVVLLAVDWVDLLGLQRRLILRAPESYTFQAAWERFLETGSAITPCEDWKTAPYQRYPSAFVGSVAPIGPVEGDVWTKIDPINGCPDQVYFLFHGNWEEMR